MKFNSQEGFLYADICTVNSRYVLIFINMYVILTLLNKTFLEPRPKEVKTAKHSIKGSTLIQKLIHERALTRDYIFTPSFLTIFSQDKPVKTHVSLPYLLNLEVMKNVSVKCDLLILCIMHRSCTREWMFSGAWEKYWSVKTGSHLTHGDTQ